MSVPRVESGPFRSNLKYIYPSIYSGQSKEIQFCNSSLYASSNFDCLSGSREKKLDSIGFNTVSLNV
jgi:hypothetical protein